MSSLLKACCSACCHLNGAKESSPGSQLASRRPVVLLSHQRPKSGPQMGVWEHELSTPKGISFYRPDSC